MDIETIGKHIVDSAYQVHKALGPGLLESVYQTCMNFELKQRGLKVLLEAHQPITYRSVHIDAGYRMDILVENLVVVENKCVENLLPIHTAQLITYLKLGGFKLGYLINWNVTFIKDGIHRIALNLPEPQWRVERK